MITPDELRAYARIDAADEDALLVSLLEAAQSVVQETTGKARPPDGSAGQTYDLAVKMLAAHWYDNRTPVDAAAAHEIPYTATMLLGHIALCGRYPKAVDA